VAAKPEVTEVVPEQICPQVSKVFSLNFLQVLAWKEKHHEIVAELDSVLEEAIEQMYSAYQISIQTSETSEARLAFVMSKEIQNKLFASQVSQLISTEEKASILNELKSFIALPKE